MLLEHEGNYASGLDNDSVEKNALPSPLPFLLPICFGYCGGCCGCVYGVHGSKEGTKERTVLPAYAYNEDYNILASMLESA